MNNRIKSFLAGLLLSSVSAAASVVVDSNVLLYLSTSNPPANYAITVNQSASFSDYTTLWFSKQNLPLGRGARLQAVTWNIDEEADYYLAQRGQEFSATTIASGIFQPLFTVDTSYTVNVPFGRFYLGINTGRGFHPVNDFDSAPNRDIFGWAELENSAAGLQLLHSAVAYDEHGILIGITETVAIPEPTTAALFLGVSCVALVCFRRGRHGCAPHSEGRSV